VLFSYVFFTVMTGLPFEFAAGDARFYDWEGARLADFFLAGNFDVGSLTYAQKLSTQGIVALIGIVYAFTSDSIIAFRIVNSLLGAWICVMIYDIARRSFGEKAARISAVLGVVAPPLIYYCGLHLKEAVIVFLVVFFINTGDQLLRGRQFKIRDIVLLLGAASLVFMFRNALAVIMILSLVTAIIFLSNRISPFFKRGAVFFVLICFFWTVLSFDLATEAREETMRYFGFRETQLEDHMRLYAGRGNEWAKYANKAIFAPLVVIGPLPTLVNTYQDNAAMLAGAMFFRNVMAFFMIVSAVLLVKRQQWRNHVFLLAVISSWIFVLANSGFALQDRFHLVLIPIIVIFAGNIISNASKKTMKYFSVYLVFIGALILSWNWFKLAGRGLI
jgi:Ca2+/Na+ antiporter